VAISRPISTQHDIVSVIWRYIDLQLQVRHYASSYKFSCFSST